ncbi:MAG: GEVED domain-containing protein, partial [Hymenobacteraceae bacterium]|nr:GEVED domain-containing protein [Hymenobacteraceae bacterium]
MKATLQSCIILILVLCCCTHRLQAQKVYSSLSLGKITEVKAAFDAKARAANSKTSDNRIVQVLPNQGSIVLQLINSKRGGPTNLYYGEVEGAANSSFYLELSGHKATGAIVLLDQGRYFKYTSAADGTVRLEEEDINRVLCANYAVGPADSEPPHVKGAAVAAAIPSLQSLPGAEAVVYLDFDGQTIDGTLWNRQFTNDEPIVAAPANLSEAEMAEVWGLMSEDFRPFNLNVTTSEAVFNNAPVNKRMRVVFTPTNYFYQNAGGAAYVGSFTWGGTSNGEVPAFVWNEGVKGAGDAGSHEVGHTLNLAHDGRTDPQEEYYAGQGDWAPIMGISYSKLVAQWSKGEYPNANNTEDDLDIITTRNGFGYRADDHGNSTGAATPLVFNADGRVSPSNNKGIISTRADVDVFSFTTEGGAINLTVSPDLRYPNLDVLVTLRNAAGAVVTTADPYTVEAHIDATLGTGIYYLVIDGTKGALGPDSDYASLGAYTISTKDYCTPAYTDGCHTYATLIDHFSFHTLVNNSSGCGSGTSKGYTNYPPSENLTTTVRAGQSYNLSMQSGSAYGQYFGVWIDYNGDMDFDDDGEFVYASPERSTNAFSASISIPADVTPGAKRMRVRSNWDPLITGAHSCTAMTWGEAEDYTITVVGH